MKNDMQENKDVVAVNEQPQDQPQANESPVASNPEPSAQPPKSKKKLWMIVGIIVLVLALVVAVASYVLMQKSNQSDKDADPLAAATKFASPQALVDEVEPELEGAVMVATEKSAGLAADGADGYAVYGPPVYRVAGAKFDSLPLEGEGVGYKSNAEVAKANYAALVKFFEENKFKRIGVEKNIIGSVSTTETANYVSYAKYESSDMVCAIDHVDASGVELKSHVTSIGCASKSSYRAAAEKLHPFYVAYMDENKDASNDLVFGMVDQGKGIDGYEYAIIYQQDQSQFKEEDESLYGAMIGYYLKDARDGKWYYFTGVQEGNGLLVCSAFDDKVLISAFNGLSCFDEKLEKNRAVQ